MLGMDLVEECLGAMMIIASHAAGECSSDPLHEQRLGVGAEAFFGKARGSFADGAHQVAAGRWLPPGALRSRAVTLLHEMDCRSRDVVIPRHGTVTHMGRDPPRGARARGLQAVR
jgi:hypothetical protein